MSISAQLQKLKNKTLTDWFIHSFSLIGIVAALAPRGLVIVLGILFALGTASQGVDVKKVKELLRKPLALILVFLCLWAGVTMSWSPILSNAPWTWVRLMLLNLLGVLVITQVASLKKPMVKKIKDAVNWGIVTGIFCLFGIFLYIVFISPGTLEHESQYSWANRSLAASALFIWFYLMTNIVEKQMKFALVLLLCVFLMFTQMASLAAVCALIISFISLCVLFTFRDSGQRILSIIFPVMVTGFAFLFFYLPPVQIMMPDINFLPFSAIHRLYIWEFVSQKIMLEPYWGWGLDAARSLPGRYSLTPIGGEFLPLHPHNASLQVWVELGIVGLLTFAVMTWQITRDKYNGFYTNALAVAFVSSYLTIGGVGYGMWQNWWIASAWIAAVLVKVFAKGVK